MSECSKGSNYARVERIPLNSGIVLAGQPRTACDAADVTEPADDRCARSRRVGRVQWRADRSSDWVPTITSVTGHRRRSRNVIVVAGLAALFLAIWMTRAGHPEEPRLVTPADFRVMEATQQSRMTNDNDDVWMAAGTDPGAGTRWADMSYWALRDIKTLSGRGRLPPAGAAAQWDYFWPRDGAFVAVAMDRTGHPDEARQILDAMAELPFDDALGFDARYTLAGNTVIDRPRGPQSDGCGWTLWAIGSVRAHGATPLPSSAGELRDRCVAHVRQLTSDGKVLPPPSPDYWEVDVSDVSLGTVAPMAAGLDAAAADYLASGDTDQALSTSTAAADLRALIDDHFGPDYERFGDNGGLDAAITFMMPPFAASEPQVVQRWSAYQSEAIRPAGGVAPGVEWKQDGISWTPETALVAYTAAASGNSDVAAQWLNWLDAQRTSWGSLPEKVNDDGLPAGPAPLLWTDALVLLTLVELQGP